MNNPWKNVTEDNRIAEIDREFISKNQQNKNRFLISTIEFPEPFIGNPNAPIYILLGSPGMDASSNNYSDLEKRLELERRNKYLTFIRPHIFNNCNKPFADVDYPFYPFDPILAQFDKGKKKSDAYHREWWRFKLFAPLIEEFKVQFYLEQSKEEDIMKVFANSFFNVELYGYHSYKTEHVLLKKSNRLPSAEYSSYLVKKAMEDGKIILMPRAVKAWFALVPGLDKYEKAFFVSVNRGIEVGKSTLSPAHYNEVLNELKRVYDDLIK